MRCATLDNWREDSRNHNHLTLIRGQDRNGANYSVVLPLLDYNPIKIGDALGGLTPLDPWHWEVHEAMEGLTGDCAMETIFVLRDDLANFGYVPYRFLLFKNADDAMIFKLRWRA